MQTPPDPQPTCEPEDLAYSNRIDDIQGPIVETGIFRAGRYEAFALTYDRQTGTYDRSALTAIEVTDECRWRVGPSKGIFETLRGHPFPCSGGGFLEGEVALRGADGSRLVFRGPAGSISKDFLAQENRRLPRDILVGLNDLGRSGGPKKAGSVRYSNGARLARFMTRLDTPLVFTAALGRVDYSVVHVPGKGTTVRVYKGRVIARRRTGSSISDYLTFKCSRRVTWRCLAGMKVFLGGKERPVTVLRAGQSKLFKPARLATS